MQKLILSLALLLVSFPLSAKPYYAEYREAGRIIVFHGNIDEQSEPRVRLLQTQYLESLKVFSRKAQFEAALSRLGVSVQEVRDEPSVSSEKAKTFVAPSTSTSGPSSSQSSTTTVVERPPGPIMPVPSYNPEDHYMHEESPPYPFDPPPNGPFSPNDPYFYP